VIVFTVEYLLRLWSCTADERFRHPVFGRLSWALTPMALIDLLVILPFWLPLVTGDLRFLRVLRLLRLLRIAKLGRYSRALQTIRAVVLERKAELATSLTFLLMLLLVASCLMYYVEHEAQPEKFPSIPAAAWWAIATLTTVGYGDVTPVTGAGKLIAGIVTILGICMLALPTAILGAGFLEHTSREAKAAGTCPHCGRELAP
jgi:voltage-gated potassium channel